MPKDTFCFKSGCMFRRTEPSMNQCMHVTLTRYEVSQHISLWGPKM